MSSPSDASPPPLEARRQPCVLAATLTVLVAACVSFTVAAWALWKTPSATLAGIDFNAALLEDFLGPYWKTAVALADGSHTPAPGYLYPSTLAWLLAPFAAVTPAGSPMVPSFLALFFVAASLVLWVGGLAALSRPTSFGRAALAGVVLGLAHAPMHGAYWAQASLPAVGLLAAGVACMHTGRPRLAGLTIGLGAALKLHPAAGVVALVVPWRSSASVKSFLCAAASAATFGVLVPMALMGRAGFLEFHRTSFGNLAKMHAWALTEEGGRGSQDLPAVFRRAFPMETPWLSQTLGWAVAAALFVGAVMVLRQARTQPAPQKLGPLIGFIALAAMPWAAISPTWPHGLLWVPAAWWCAFQHRSHVGRGLAALSFACGSIAALRAFGTPEAYAWFGLPAWSAGLALAAVVPAWKSTALR